MVASQLALYAYTIQGNNVIGAVDYGAVLQDLEFSTIAPGGFGDLKCKIKVASARLIPPELHIFAQVALIAAGAAISDGSSFVFLGRWDDPGIVLRQNDGDILELTAQGAASVLKDDPDDQTYVAQTAQYILAHELSRRSNYLQLDQDTSAILPNNPASTFTAIYTGKDLDAILAELNGFLGDYVWWVWEHPRNRDAANFPTWQLQWRQRDTTTVAYIAQMPDAQGFDIRPAAEWCYNVVTVNYTDAASGQPASITVKDARLNANGSQGSAPFPWRRLRKDITATKLSSAQAATYANALLGQYKNGGFKISVDLDSVANASGAEIPLWSVRAGRNILLPELSPFGTILPSGVVVNTNLFYITETRYTEGSSAPKLKLTCNTFSDQAAFQLARLQYGSQSAAQNSKTVGVVQAPGAPETGTCGASWGASAVVADTYGCGQCFKTTMSAAPTSITFTQTSATNSGTPFASNITVTGFQFGVHPAANGAGNWVGTYTTVGN